MNKAYINPKQRAFLESNARIVLFLGGRGTGKSTVLTIKQRMRMISKSLSKHSIPRALTALSSSTYGQILEKTLPAMTEMFDRMGMAEDVHYVIGRRPPDNFQKPYASPKSYKNVISYRNGNAQMLMSMDRPDLGRGGSYQAIDVDEAALVPGEHFRTVMLPSLRGGITRFKGRSMYRQVCLYSSVPWKSKGKWLLEYIDKAEKDPKTYCVIESVSADNIHVLGQDYIDLMRKELTPLEFAREIMNEVVSRAERMFYHEFNEDRHLQSYTYRYNDTDEGIEISGKAEYWPDQQIDVSFDFGGWFTGMLVFQSDMVDSTPYEYMIDSIGVTEGDNMVEQLVANFCVAYQFHTYKIVQIWGEPRGHDRNALDQSIYQVIEREFKKNGWRVIIKVRPVRTKMHYIRHEFVNKCLAERDPKYPRLRMIQEKTKDATVAILTAEVKPDGTKDKKNEKDRNFPQEHATHYTDMLDYYLFYKWSKEAGGLMSEGGSSFSDTILS